jgi:hypothetical protein
LLLRKDLLVLRRSPLLLAILHDLSPWPEVAREGLWLLVLGRIFGLLARVEARRLLA